MYRSSTSQVVAHVNTAIPQTFVQQLLEPGSPVMKLRTSSDEAVSIIDSGKKKKRKTS